VEDDELVRPLLAEALRRNGYTTRVAGDGSEAMGVVRDPSVTIDLIVTDVVMPLMSGPEMVQLVELARPGLPVLYLSGYADQALVHQKLRKAGTYFMQKPFEPEAFGRKVREILDAREPRRAAA